jgi:hypothetical protein
VRWEKEEEEDPLGGASHHKNRHGAWCWSFVGLSLRGLVVSLLHHALTHALYKLQVKRFVLGMPRVSKAACLIKGQDARAQLHEGSSTKLRDATITHTHWRGPSSRVVSLRLSPPGAYVRWACACLRAWTDRSASVPPCFPLAAGVSLLPRRCRSEEESQGLTPHHHHHQAPTHHMHTDTGHRQRLHVHAWLVSFLCASFLRSRLGALDARQGTHTRTL